MRPYDVQASSTLAVKAEVLGVRLCNDKLHAEGIEQADGLCIVLKRTSGESCVRELG